MLLELPIATFAAVAALDLEVRVYCPSCHHRTQFDPLDPRLADLPFAGARFRCTTVRQRWSAHPPETCNGLGHVHIRPPADRLILPRQSIPYVVIQCPRCVPFWQIDQAPRHEPQWKELFDRGTPIRCPACRSRLNTTWHGLPGMPFTDGYGQEVNSPGGGRPTSLARLHYHHSGDTAASRRDALASVWLERRRRRGHIWGHAVGSP